MKKTDTRQVYMTPYEGELLDKKSQLAGLSVSGYIMKALRHDLYDLKPLSFDATDFIINTIDKAVFEEICDQYDTIETVMITYINKGIGYEFIFLFDGDRLVFKGNKFYHECQNITFDYDKIIAKVNEHYEPKLIKNENNTESDNDDSELSDY